MIKDDGIDKSVKGKPCRKMVKRKLLVNFLVKNIEPFALIYPFSLLYVGVLWQIIGKQNKNTEEIKLMMISGLYTISQQFPFILKVYM